MIGTAGADNWAPGQNGISLNTDGDVDITLSPSPSTMPLEFYGMGGDDRVNGRGQGGAGLHYLGPLIIEGGDGDDVLLRGSEKADVILGGPGNDRLEAQDSADLLDGGAGDDYMAAGGGNDSMTGGPGADTFVGSGEDDILFANDGEPDGQLNGGPGTDTAYYEAALDTSLTARRESDRRLAADTDELHTAQRSHGNARHPRRLRLQRRHLRHLRRHERLLRRRLR